MKVLLNIATHGNEKLGVKVAKAIEKIPISKGELIINIANEKALKLNKRFCDEDLNRCFPGNPNGNYEQKRAHELLPLIKSVDVVLDIHSTTTDLRDTIIVTQLEDKTRDYIKRIGPRYVLVMNATKNNALISNAKIGIGFEYGKDNDVAALKNNITGIKNLLSHLGMIEYKVIKNRSKISYFNVYEAVPKPKGAKLLDFVKNYKLIRKGWPFATIGKKYFITAEKDFYPILFGEKRYKDIFGFAGDLLS